MSILIHRNQLNSNETKSKDKEFFVSYGMQNLDSRYFNVNFNLLLMSSSLISLERFTEEINAKFSKRI